MASETGLFNSITIDESAGGTPVTINKGLVTFPQFQQNPETLLLATGINQRLRDRDEATVIIQDISAFAALKALMLTRTAMQFDINGARTHTWDPVRFSVRYVLDQVPNASEIFIGADAASGTPTSDPGNWTSLGTIQGGNAPTISIEGANDGVGLPLYTATSLNWTLRLIDDASTAIQTTLASFQRALCRIAILSPDGSYLILGGASANEGVFAQWSAAPRFAVNEFSSAVDLNLSGVAEDPDDLIVIPGSAPDYVYAFEFAFAAVSTNQSDYYSAT